MLFEENIVNMKDDFPILLFDTSGSTSSLMNSSKSILETEINVAKKILTDKNIQRCKIISWSTNSIIASNNADVKDIYKIVMKNKTCGNTNICPAINIIPSNWLSKYTDIYIITDGEISDGYKFSATLKSFMKKNIDKKINFHIITVESNNFNYNADTSNNIYAGNAIYQTIKSNNLSYYLKSFLCYNNFFTDEYYTNIFNPDTLDGYIPFRNKVFNINNTNLFIEYVKSLVDNEDNIRLCYDLTYTIHMITKNKPDNIKKNITDLFTNLFIGTKEYSQIKTSLSDQVFAHKNGNIESFQDYKNKRSKLFETSQKKLYDNVSECVSEDECNFVSFPLNNRVITANKKSVCDTIILRNKEYKFGSVCDETYMYPMFPMNVSKTESIRQCIRQYIRAVYSTYYYYKESSDDVLYLFLTDVMRIRISNLPKKVKDAYKDLALVMLDRRRFASNLDSVEGNIKEIKHLEEGNPPMPVVGEFKIIEKILKNCAKNFGYNIKPYTLWYAIVLSLDNDKLILNQYKYCKDDINCDFPNLNPQKLLGMLEKKEFIYNKINSVNSEDLDYTCFITLDDTHATGGYKIPEHTIAGSICNPKYVFSQEAYDGYKKQNLLTCPICYSKIQLNNISIIPPYQNKINVKCKGLCDSIDMKKLCFKNKLRCMDDIDFNVVGYKFTSGTVITNLMGAKAMSVRNEKQFIDVVIEKYPFLSKINMKNVCIAGGFCKSILLDQNVNDIDFFLYGLPNKRLIIKLTSLINEIMDQLKKEYPNILFLVLYKETSHVLELISFDVDKKLNINNIKKNLTKQLKHKIDDCDGITFLNKMQFILTRNENIADIINNFDLMSSSVAYDGRHVYFNDKASFAYKYMINIIDESNYSDLFDFRLLKYYSSGFSIGIKNMPDIKLESNSNLKINKCIFNIMELNGNNIIVDSEPTIDDNENDNLKCKNFYTDISGSEKTTIGVLSTVQKYIELNNTTYAEFTIENKINKINLQFVDSVSNKQCDHVWCSKETMETY